MYIRSVKVKGKRYYRIVESYREHGKVKQRYLTALGSDKTGDEEYRPAVLEDMQRDDIRSVEDHPELKKLALKLAKEEDKKDTLKSIQTIVRRESKLVPQSEIGRANKGTIIWSLKPVL